MKSPTDCSDPSTCSHTGPNKCAFSCNNPRGFTSNKHPLNMSNRYLPQPPNTLPSGNQFIADSVHTFSSGRRNVNQQHIHSAASSSRNNVVIPPFRGRSQSVYIGNNQDNPKSLTQIQCNKRQSDPRAISAVNNAAPYRNASLTLDKPVKLPQDYQRGSYDASCHHKNNITFKYVGDRRFVRKGSKSSNQSNKVAVSSNNININAKSNYGSQRPNNIVHNSSFPCGLSREGDLNENIDSGQTACWEGQRFSQAPKVRSSKIAAAGGGVPASNCTKDLYQNIDEECTEIQTGTVTGKKLKPMKLQFFKTKLCPWLKSVGFCRKGSGCRYAHSKEEVRPLPNLTRTKMCDVFLQSGSCIEGDACKYAHCVEDLRATVAFQKTKLCPLWLIGNCSSGDDCRFAHGSEELRILNQRNQESQKSHEEETVDYKDQNKSAKQFLGLVSLDKDTTEKVDAWDDIGITRGRENDKESNVLLKRNSEEYSLLASEVEREQWQRTQRLININRIPCSTPQWTHPLSTNVSTYENSCSEGMVNSILIDNTRMSHQHLLPNTSDHGQSPNSNNLRMDWTGNLHPQNFTYEQYMNFVAGLQQQFEQHHPTSMSRPTSTFSKFQSEGLNVGAADPIEFPKETLTNNAALAARSNERTSPIVVTTAREGSVSDRNWSLTNRDILFPPSLSEVDTMDRHSSHHKNNISGSCSVYADKRDFTPISNFQPPDFGLIRRELVETPLHQTWASSTPHFSDQQGMFQEDLKRGRHPISTSTIIDTRWINEGRRDMQNCESANSDPGDSEGGGSRSRGGRSKSNNRKEANVEDRFYQQDRHHGWLNTYATDEITEVDTDQRFLNLKQQRPEIVSQIHGQSVVLQYPPGFSPNSLNQQAPVVRLDMVHPPLWQNSANPGMSMSHSPQVFLSPGSGIPNSPGTPPNIKALLQSPGAFGSSSPTGHLSPDGNDSSRYMSRLLPSNIFSPVSKMNITLKSPASNRDSNSSFASVEERVASFVCSSDPATGTENGKARSVSNVGPSFLSSQNGVSAGSSDAVPAGMPNIFSPPPLPNASSDLSIPFFSNPELIPSINKHNQTVFLQPSPPSLSPFATVSVGEGPVGWISTGAGLTTLFQQSYLDFGQAGLLPSGTARLPENQNIKTTDAKMDMSQNVKLANGMFASPEYYKQCWSYGATSGNINSSTTAGSSPTTAFLSGGSTPPNTAVKKLKQRDMGGPGIVSTSTVPGFPALSPSHDVEQLKVINTHTSNNNKNNAPSIQVTENSDDSISKEWLSLKTCTSYDARDQQPSENCENSGQQLPEKVNFSTLWESGVNRTPLSSPTNFSSSLFENQPSNSKRRSSEIPPSSALGPVKTMGSLLSNGTENDGDSLNPNFNSGEYSDGLGESNRPHALKCSLSLPSNIQHILEQEKEALMIQSVIHEHGEKTKTNQGIIRDSTSSVQDSTSSTGDDTKLEQLGDADEGDTELPKTSSNTFVHQPSVSRVECNAADLPNCDLTNNEGSCSPTDSGNIRFLSNVSEAELMDAQPMLYED